MLSLVFPCNDTNMTVFQFLGIVDFPSRLFNGCYIGGGMLSFKVTTVGSSEGFILNKEAKAKLNVKKGDVIFLTEAPDGAVYFTHVGLAFHGMSGRLFQPMSGWFWGSIERCG
jgi:hypothetical protein